MNGRDGRPRLWTPAAPLWTAAPLLPPPRTVGRPPPRLPPPPPLAPSFAALPPPRAVPRNGGAQKACRCGSTTHSRTSHRDCPLRGTIAPDSHKKRPRDGDGDACRCGSTSHKRTNHRDCPLRLAAPDARATALEPRPVPPPRPPAAAPRRLPPGADPFDADTDDEAYAREFPAAPPRPFCPPAPAPEPRAAPRKRAERRADAPPRVVVVGAGLAGLGCARELERLGCDVVVVEARGRVGGRCRAVDLGGGVRVDLGASWIHGVRKNPVYDAACDLALHGVDTGDDVVLRDGGTGAVLTGAAGDDAAFARFNDALAAARARGDAAALREARAEVGGAAAAAAAPRHGRDLSLGRCFREALGAGGGDAGFVDWHVSNLEYANACPLDALSLRHWDQDDTYAYAGSHCVLRETFQGLCEGLAASLKDLRLNAAAARVEVGIARPASPRAAARGGADAPGALRCGKGCGRVFVHGSGRASHERTCAGGAKRGGDDKPGCRVSLASGARLDADAVVVTAPLGVLKAGAIAFSPPLPAWKRAAIDRVGFGLLNKVALRFDRCFWREPRYWGGEAVKARNLGRVAGDGGHLFLWVDMEPAVDAPVLVALCPANAAERLETRLDASGADACRPAPPALVAECVGALAKLLGASDADRATWRVEMSAPVWKPNLQPDFNMSVFECFDTSSSAGLRELDESNRFVQKSSESTSI